MSEPKTNMPTQKKKISTRKLAALIITGLAILFLLSLIGGLIVMASMLKDKPELDLSNLENQESTIIYDINGNVIAELGVTIRENVSYDELPTSLIDAFVAVEDSRFYAHNGFDLPRFSKAIIDNIRTLSFGQGGSTFTMQLVKNSYFVDDEAGISAPRKVSRKVQEIALALELENTISKDSIFELYINKINFGGSRNIRGVQKASEYFFGKDVTELTLSESALLAGVINAPTAYNPFNHIEAATARRDVVLDLMHRHGYITEKEFELAKAVKVENLLVNPYGSSGGGNSYKYQAYIDQVITELYELTGLDPYYNSMHVYTYMDPEVQSLIDDIQKGNVDGYFEYPDEYFELASIVVNNKSGGIYGILGGRNYANGGALLLNHATEQYKQPGSSIKPILDYALAFENLGWATSHVLIDRPIVYPGTNSIVANATGQYYGQIRLLDAVGNSLNTTAIQTLQEVVNKTSNAYVVDYMQSMGYDVKLENFNIQYAIGGSDLEVSCLQMAGAQAALANQGNYIKPHTIQRVEFNSEKAPITPTYTPVNTLSPQAAYLTTELLYNNVVGGYSGFLGSLQDEYKVYAKTGTTDWGTAGRDYNIPIGAIKDAWITASTSEFTTATWMGYERASLDRQSYILREDYLRNIHGKTTNLILDKLAEVYGNPADIARPDGITNIQHILGVFPYTSIIPDMDPQYITNGEISAKDAKLLSPEDIDIENLSGANIGIDTDGQGTINIEWAPYPNEKQLSVAENTIDISLYGNNGEVLYEAYGNRLFDYSWVYGPIQYKADILVNNQLVETISNSDETFDKQYDLLPDTEVEVKAYYGFERGNVKSNILSKKAKIEDIDVKITLPGAEVNTKEGLEEWAKSYNLAINIVDTPTNDSSKVGTYRIKKVDTPNEYYPIDGYFTLKKSQILNAVLEVEYYIERFAISIDKKEIYPGDKFKLTVNSQENIRWEIVDGSEYLTQLENGEFEVAKDIKEEVKAKIRAYNENNTKAEIEITILKKSSE